MKVPRKWPHSSGGILGVFYAVLAICGLGLSLLPGYILTLDMVFTPKLHVVLDQTNLLPWKLVLAALNLILPGQIIEKLILLVIFTLAGLGVHCLLPEKNEWARYAAGVLYVINPFTYSRLMAGQYLVLAGYALMPWFVAALLRFIRQPERATALRLGLWTVAIAFVSLHTLGFAIMVGLIALVIAAFRPGEKAKFRKILGWGSVAAVGVVVVNSFWLVSALMGRGSQAALISGFDTRDLLSFRTSSDATFGQLINTLGLYGFWGDREGLYLLPKAVNGIWWLELGVILAIVAVGVWKYWRQYRLELVLMLSVLLASWVLAQGIMGSPFAEFNAFLYQHLPFFRGYREPGKFVALIALPLAYGFGLGASWLIDHTRRWPVAHLLPGLLIALPILYTPTMLWGAAGQLRAVDYPADWYSLNRTLDAGPKSEKVLFLPWHQYMYFNFAGRLIANPASRFFDRQVIQGDNAEIGLIERQSSNPTSTFIQSQILASGRTDVAAKLKSLGITRVVLAKGADYKDYAWLDRTPGLRVVSDTATLKVYMAK